MRAHRVAITGVGVVSPLGNSLTDFHRALAEARSGIGLLPQHVTEGSGVKVGALIDWDPAPLFKPAEAENMDRVSQFALAAAGQALAASALDLEGEDRCRIGVH